MAAADIYRGADEIDALLMERIAQGDFPSAVYAVTQEGVLEFAGSHGLAVAHESTKIPATLQTIYDLASLTKPLVTGLLVARQIELGTLRLDDTLSRHLPEFDRPESSGITIRHLLTHTSGLPAWRPLALLTDGRPERAAKAVAELRLENEPGSRVLYSDLGFITLGFIVERITDVLLSDLAQLEIINRLGLKRTFFNPAQAFQTETAACELGNAYERDMCKQEAHEGADRIAWREQLIWGEVHDGNAHFLGGAAGHAGLFSTVTETARLAAQFIASTSETLSAATCELFRQNMTPGLNEARSFGWQLAATPDSTAGAALPPDAFGHLGFTGTSCWIDPGKSRAFVLLTNRTHVSSFPFVNINTVRRRFHSLAVAALEKARMRNEG